MYKNLLNFSARVDFQAALLAVLVSLCSAFAISYYYHTKTYDIIKATYSERSNNIHAIVNENISSASFTEINSADDIGKTEYVAAKKTLYEIREAFQVLYLYTASVNENGDFIYIIDGLSEDDDFRFPGDNIEAEIIPEMQRALNGEIVYPEEVKKTSWGNIFVTYFPYYDNTSNEILGVIGIEFKADDLYTEYEALKHLTAYIVIISLILTVTLSSFIFRRMSNPNIKDTTYIDKETLLKNRTAFNLEMHKLEQREYFDGKGIILVDIDKLKNVNRVIGPYEGDVYIKLVAEVILSSSCSSMMSYRLKGGEFAIIATHLKEEELKDFCESITNQVAEHEHLPVLETGITCGYALFKKNDDLDLRDTITRADRMLYTSKRKKLITSDT